MEDLKCPYCKSSNCVDLIDKMVCMDCKSVDLLTEEYIPEVRQQPLEEVKHYAHTHSYTKSDLPRRVEALEFATFRKKQQYKYE